jgi:GAF domain-containing protein
VPIWLGEDQVSGLIYLDHLMHGYMFTEADRELLHAIANLVALVLSRPRA